MAGAHRGYRVTKRKLKNSVSFTVQVRRADRSGYGETQTFNSRNYPSAKEAEAVAKKWCAETYARVVAGIKSRNSGRVKTSEALDLFIKTIREQQLNERHLHDTKQRLSSLPDYCPDLGHKKASQQIYDWWKNWCACPKKNSQPKSDATKNVGLRDCKTFLRWCYKARAITGLQEAVDVDWIERVRVEKTVKPQFTIQELKLGFTATQTGCDKITRPHPFVIRWALYVFLGLRLREALILRWDDFNNGFVLVRGKGRKQRLVHIQKELEPYLKQHRKQHDYDGYLFPEHVRKCDLSNAVKMFDRFLNHVGIEKKERSTHSIRHCYAGIMTATGEPTAMVQAYMGHSQSDMTQHYAQMAARFRNDVKGWGRGEFNLGVCLLE